jgi:hypothetical protein
VVYLIGDSLSVGIMGPLRALGWDVVGSPVVGARMDGMVGQTYAAAASGASAIHIMGGTNDAAGGASGNVLLLRAQKLVDIAKAAGVPVVFTPPPASRRDWNANLDDFRSALGQLSGAWVGSQTLSVGQLGPDGVHPIHYQELASIVGQNIRDALGSSESPGSNVVSYLALGVGAVAAALLLTRKS